MQRRETHGKCSFMSVLRSFQVVSDRFVFLPSRWQCSPIGVYSLYPENMFSVHKGSHRRLGAEQILSCMHLTLVL